MVERVLSMHEAQGSIPCFSTFCFFLDPFPGRNFDFGSASNLKKASRCLRYLARNPEHADLDALNRHHVAPPVVLCAWTLWFSLNKLLCPTGIGEKEGPRWPQLRYLLEGRGWGGKVEEGMVKGMNRYRGGGLRERERSMGG
jgi:hypothetical protein